MQAERVDQVLAAQHRDTVVLDTGQGIFATAMIARKPHPNPQVTAASNPALNDGSSRLNGAGGSGREGKPPGGQDSSTARYPVL